MRYEDAALEADVLTGVPPHPPPRVSSESGLTGDGDWIRVAPATLETATPHVYAIGDCTHITLANGLPLPKAGPFAELAGLRVAAAIAADVRDEPAPAAFDGRGYCFIELGGNEASRSRPTSSPRPSRASACATRRRRTPQRSARSRRSG